MSKKSGTTKKDEDNIPTLRETIQSTVNAYLKEKIGSDKVTIDVSRRSNVFDRLHSLTYIMRRVLISLTYIIIIIIIYTRSLCKKVLIL